MVLFLDLAVAKYLFSAFGGFHGHAYLLLKVVLASFSETFLRAGPEGPLALLGAHRGNCANPFAVVVRFLFLLTFLAVHLDR